MKLGSVDKALLEAIDLGDAEAVDRALADGANPNLMGPYGTPVLHLACKGQMEPPRRLAVMQRLLEAGADPDQPDSSGAPVLFEAAALGYGEVCRALIDADASIDGRISILDETLLFSAARGGLLWLVEDCLEAGQAVDQASRQGVRPIHHAAEGGAEVVQRLIDAGAAPDVTDALGVTPLVNAVARGPLNAIRLLLDLGLDVDVTFWDSQSRPLMVAAMAGRPEVIDLLADRGADLSAGTTEGLTALHTAVSAGRGEAAARLLAAGAPLDAQDDHGWTALHLAASGGRAELARALLAAGASPEAQTTKARTLDAVEVPEGSTPAQIATLTGHDHLAALL